MSDLALALLLAGAILAVVGPVFWIVWSAFDARCSF